MSDAECRWDDACLPKRCIAGRAPPANCDESSLPPGECKCVARQCTLRPKPMPKATGPCEPGGCVVDRAGGVCVADTRGIPEGLRTRPPVEEGPTCDCNEPARGCEMTWIDRVPCKSDRDCWVSHVPRTHPIARPAHLKGRAFKPCSDGEVPPVCTSEGFCALGPGYRC